MARAASGTTYWPAQGQRERSAIASNVLDRQFQADGSNQKWVADFTYIWTAEGWLYAAAVLDLYSRRIVGWSMQESMTSQLVADALMMVVWRRGKPVALVHHCDQGSQYTSEHFQELLKGQGITCSMSRAGEVWDNSAMESFFSSLKTERTAKKVYRSREQARVDVFDDIERLYNPNRRHSTLGYVSPIDFEKASQAWVGVHGVGSSPYLRDPLSVDDLAEVAGLSPRQFSRAFRAETGRSPARAVEQLRVEAARVLLEQGRLQMAVIAREVGLVDRERLRRAFVRTFGQVPRTVRRAWRSGNTAQVGNTDMPPYGASPRPHECARHSLVRPTLIVSFYFFDFGGIQQAAYSDPELAVYTDEMAQTSWTKSLPTCWSCCRSWSCCRYSFPQPLLCGCRSRSRSGRFDTCPPLRLWVAAQTISCFAVKMPCPARNVSPSDAGMRQFDGCRHR